MAGCSGTNVSTRGDGMASARRRFDLRAFACALALVTAGGVGAVAVAPAAYAQAYKPGRLADGKTPDFRGIWQVVETKAGVNLEGSPGQPSVIYAPANGKIPYKPEARKLQQANYKDRMNLDPLRKCFQGGVPRSTMSSMPMQFVQGEGGYLALIHQENHAFRFFYPDSRPHYEDIDSWMGDNRYRWDGDVLVTSNKAQSPTWLDDAGNHHTNKMEVVERYTMTDANTIRYEATITDEEVFTGPWSIRLTLKRNTTPGAALIEDECIPDENGVRRRVDPFKPEALVKNTNRRWTLIPEQK
jgi:hypothetical protein